MFPTGILEPNYYQKRFQPTGAAFTTSSTGTGLGTPTHTNDAQAYDLSPGTAADINVTEILLPGSTGTLSQIATYNTGFGIGTISGVLAIFAISSTNETTELTAVADSVVKLEYSTNAGGAWTTMATVTGSATGWTLGSPVYHYFSTPIDISQLWIRATATGVTTFVSVLDKTGASADLQIFDISFS